MRYITGTLSNKLYNIRRNPYRPLHFKLIYMCMYIYWAGIYLHILRVRQWEHSERILCDIFEICATVKIQVVIDHCGILMKLFVININKNKIKTMYSIYQHLLHTKIMSCSFNRSDRSTWLLLLITRID